jgi:ATP-dependent exoDNAse (exonuclease V) beta subunit
LSLLPPLTTIRQYILEIIDIFDVDYDDYVCCFIDNVNNCGDIVSVYSFIHWWETNGSLIKVEFCNNTDSIKVMTIHQSKGLEFKNVIIPFELHFDEKLNHSDLDWYTYEGYDIPIHYNKNIINTEFTEFYYSEHMMRCYDNLNTIYVAYTRAIDHMILIKLVE